MTHLKNWQTKFATTRPRRLLALDGGGIRGVMSLEILRKIEQDLATATGKGASFRLGDFFDYIGGTSTGAIIAAGLAMGKSVQELIDFYIEAGPLMFEKSSLIGRLRSFYQADPLRKKLNSVFGERTLGADDLCSLLLIVTRNATTDSPWPVSNNPFAKYNDRTRKDCNLQIPLWQLVRASTAAPVYFPPEIVAWDKDDPAKTFFFVDGGVTPYNNPAFHAVPDGDAAAVPAELARRRDRNDADFRRHGIGGSGQPRPQRARAIGAGQRRAPSRRADGRRRDRPGYQLPRCRPLRVRRADRPGARRHDSAAAAIRSTGTVVPLEEDCGRQFLYARYNPDVSRDGLDALGLNEIDPDHVQALDQIEYINEMQSVGRNYAEKFVDMKPFQRFVKRLTLRSAVSAS